MTSPVLDPAAQQQGHGARAPVAPSGHGWLNRAVFYVPRFSRHLRRRLRSGMSMDQAWRSARLRMHDYRGL